MILCLRPNLFLIIKKRAFYLSRDKKNFALLMEQGTGKTKVIIDSAAYLYANGAMIVWLLLHLMVFIGTLAINRNANSFCQIGVLVNLCITNQACLKIN